MTQLTVAEWVAENTADIRIGFGTTFDNINFPIAWKEAVFQELKHEFEMSSGKLRNLMRTTYIHIGTRQAKIFGSFRQMAVTWNSEIHLTRRWWTRADVYLKTLKKHPMHWGTPQQAVRTIDLDMFLTLAHEMHHAIEQKETGWYPWLFDYVKKWKPWHINRGHAHAGEKAAYAFEDRVRGLIHAK